LKPKDASKIFQSLRKWKSLTFSTFSSPQKRIQSINALSLRIPVRCPTLIGLAFPLASFVGIAEKRKKLLTCTQETTRAKLE
jgi:hypothetical protein